jgi:hypothetical protein
MTAKEYDTDIFGAELVDSATIEGLIISVYANAIVHIKVQKYISVTAITFEKSKEYFATLGPEKRYHFVFEFANFSDVDPNMRKQRATKEGTQFSLSDALVISNLPQKMIGDFYLRINKPVRPTKVFFSIDKALAWSLKKKEEMTGKMD